MWIVVYVDYGSECLVDVGDCGFLCGNLGIIVYKFGVLVGGLGEWKWYYGVEIVNDIVID